jgi:hypothetical protein
VSVLKDDPVPTTRPSDKSQNDDGWNITSIQQETR